MYLLKNARLVPELTEGYHLPLGDVLLEGGFIKDIQKPGQIPEEGAVAIDLAGKTLLPGLFDLHAHLSYAREVYYKSPGKITLDTYSFAREYLKWGYTTVRDCGSLINCVADIRDAINGGELEGPRLIASGLIITPTETGNVVFKELYAEADGPAEFCKAARVELQKNNDFVKIMATGAYMNEGGDPGRQIATFEEIKAAVDAAKMKGSYVAAHCHGTEAIKACVRAGVRTIEHGSFIDEEGVRMIQDAEDCYLIPTASITYYSRTDDPEVSDDARRKASQYAPKEAQCLYNAYSAGLPLGFGSDIYYEVIRDRPGYEFSIRKDFYGFGDRDILIQATKNSAKIAKLDQVLGTIAVSKYADLIVVDGNPDEDIHLMQKPLVHVFKEGREVTR